VRTITTWLLAVGLVTSARWASADPSDEAKSKIGYAIDACEDALKGGHDENWSVRDVKDRADAYQSYRAQAAQSDRNVLTWTGTVRGHYKVSEWVSKCDTDVPKAMTRAQGKSAGIEAKQHDANARDAAIDATYAACFADGSPEADATKRAAKHQAALATCKQDIADFRTKYGSEKVIPDRHHPGQKEDFDAAEAKMKVGLAGQDKRDADWSKDIAARKTQDAKDQKEFAAYRSKLKGDRLKVFDEWHRYPENGTTQQTLTSSDWAFTTTADVGEVHNKTGDTVGTVTGNFVCRYHFNGSHLVSKKCGH